MVSHVRFRFNSSLYPRTASSLLADPLATCAEAAPFSLMVERFDKGLRTKRSCQPLVERSHLVRACRLSNKAACPQPRPRAASTTNRKPRANMIRDAVGLSTVGRASRIGRDRLKSPVLPYPAKALVDRLECLNVTLASEVQVPRFGSSSIGPSGGWVRSEGS